ncbi:BCCT family transporter [Granulosicoccus antarcticus]|uniref:Glycine betaine transporter OpuD n=1 Tax=Granulosicoccus antarcticus IMCC3135 TaxID=1192854 RepID=A0A2Z2NUC3_9GAMM|nr:BCCT family transporter [Granulosicoccus antarcticus]ASJ71257.1 Glycine betaine transporter OpuD [Granulosicoccus antarcticus IMCC3135]
MSRYSKPGDSLDLRVFIPAMTVLVAVIAPLILFPESGPAMVNAAFSFATGQFGWLYMLAGFGAVVFLIGLAFSKYGNVRLGGPDDAPEFSYFSWIAMIFCGGIGIAIVNWAWVEPIYYFTGPPFGVEPKSPEAAEWALTYGQFHWGLTPWAIYCLPAIPIAYSMYVRRQPGVRLSEAARGVLGRYTDKWPGILLDSIVVFGVIGGVGTSLGLAIPLVSKLAGSLLGISPSLGLDLSILAIWTVIFGASVWFGLSKGIRILSDTNVILAILLLVFTAVIGPTLFMLNGWVQGFGQMLSNFVTMSTRTDPLAQSTFTQDWTIFYWAWWIAYAPMMGLFVARISRGRTIRELIVAELVWGSLGCWVFFAVWGGYALDLQISGALDVSAILSTEGIPATVLAILNTMPMPQLVTVVFIVLCFIFLATTLDSAAYVLASVTSHKLSGYQEPKRWIRIMWALILAVVGIVLIQLGGLKPVQTSTIVVALPLIPVLVILTISLLRWLKEDFGEQSRTAHMLIRSPDSETAGDAAKAPSID